jgi:Cof subfamily protein (haloacid dehalogenase superfamily)
VTASGQAPSGGPAGRGRLLVAVDVDGTLLNSEFEDVLRPREADALRAVVAAGHVCALCTGRSNRTLERVLASGGDGLADLPLILLNGAVVIGGEPRRMLAHHVLPTPVLRRLVELFHAHGTLAMVYDVEERGGFLYHEAREPNSVLGRYLQRRCDGTGACLAVTDLLACLPESAFEVGTIDTFARVESLSRSIREELGEQVNVVNTQTLLARESYCWAEVYVAAASKGEGAMLLAREYGIPPERIVALGDNYNDLDLFAVAGHRVAMADAPAEVRAAADRLAPPVTASGAAAILEEIAAGTWPVPGEECGGS